jgi:hypothetical protein
MVAGLRDGYFVEMQLVVASIVSGRCEYFALMAFPVCSTDYYLLLRFHSLLIWH